MKGLSLLYLISATRQKPRKEDALKPQFFPAHTGRVIFHFVSVLSFYRFTDVQGAEKYEYWIFFYHTQRNISFSNKQVSKQIQIV